MSTQHTPQANNLLITKERVKAWSACTDGYRWFLEKFPQGGEFAEIYRALQDDRRYDDSGWLADRVFAELDAPTKAQQTVKIAGADRALIEKAAQDAGTEDGAATTGDWANAATTGNRANAATTGYRANAATTGEGAIAASLGASAKAKASGGGAIVLAHRKPNGELIGVFASMVGQNGIKPDVWYKMSDAGPVEVLE